MTLLASFAQEESRSIGDNIRWGVRRLFADGISNGHKPPYGYTWDGEMFRIVPAEGEIVKEIFRRYFAGESAYAIAKSLAGRGITGRQGRPIEQTTVKDILSNISYTGTMALQKNYISEGHIHKRNKGELPIYMVDGMFEPLVSRDDFDKTEEIRKQRAEQSCNRNPVLMPFSGMVRCGCCGGWYRAKVWHSTDKYRRVIYRCNKKYAQKGKPCSTRHLTEEEIKQIFVKALNSLVEVKENVIAELTDLIDGVCQTGELVEAHNRVEQELRVLAEHLETLIHENARVAQDQTAYLKQENEIRARYMEKQGILEKLDEQIAAREGKRKTLEGMIQVVCGINGDQVEFDEDLWGGVLDHIVVKGDGQVIVVFKGEIEINIE